MAVLTKLTIEDFEKLPDVLAHNHELVNGELVDVSGNTRRHIKLRDFLMSKLLPYVEDHKLGEVVSEQEFDFCGDAHGPDLSFVDAARIGQLAPDRRVQLVVPDLAVEIASRNDRIESLLEKRSKYRDCGTKEVWLLVIPVKRAFVFSGDGDRVLYANEEFSTRLIPGSSILLKDLFNRA